MLLPETLLGSHLWGVMGPLMDRPQPPLLALLLPGVSWLEEGRGKGEGNGMGTPHPGLPRCGTNQFSPNFCMSQSGARSDKEFHSRQSGARLNAVETHPPGAQVTAKAQLPTLIMPCGSTGARGGLTAPKAGGCPSPADHSLVASRPLSLCPGEARAVPPEQ